ncbi:hypothetical protein [Noviherbaspirillum saxi]|uniref:Uncharacterized protein n=1 Tax=Noviherbaspirillum saxi TaxID=2320863 RepID=A0A3A3FSP1_9BURK|nr:hypothetical protein [Noviherbaspirillum saxi]RJF99066.1 hypothetical protein D3871_11480 [Noviherbaspirillum saxi]
MTTKNEQMREAVKALDTYVSEQLEDYEFRGDPGDYTPNETERMLMNDFVQGMISDDEFFVLTGKIAALRESAPAPQELTDNELEHLVSSALDDVESPELSSALTYERWKDGVEADIPTVDAKAFARALLSRSTAPQEAAPVAIDDLKKQNAELVKDAQRWRAVLASARVRPLGSAGLNDAIDPNGSPYNGYAHLGLELWTIFGKSLNDEQRERLVKENALGREWLTKYADIASAHQEDKQ